MKRSSFLSLLLLLPAPSIGVFCGMVLWPGTATGKGIFLFSKIWILLIPAVWFFVVQRGRLTRGKTAPGGFRMGLLSGFAISAFIVLMYWVLGRRLIDPGFVREMAEQVGLVPQHRYLLGALYWFCINSVLEEYVWRWFVVRQCSALMKPKAAIAVSALAFTVHHIIAMQVYFNGIVTAVGAAGIAFGGAFWSWMFLRYETIWPGWVSHAVVDVAIFALGYLIIFG